MELSDIVAISAVRTPMGRFGGTLKDVASYDLGAAAIRAALQRAGVAGDGVDDVSFGSCRQAGNGPNPHGDPVFGIFFGNRSAQEGAGCRKVA